MARALELAERARGSTHPNPLVGAVIERDGEIIGEGFHTRFGAAHAEIEAIRDVQMHHGAEACRGAVLHVTLEPCAHHGKTPPCVEAIIRAGLGRVVFALDDPNPLVAGKGRAALEAAGIKVESGVEVEAARRQNRAYLHWRATGLPLVTWKVATTLDGRASFETGKPASISSPESRARTDRLRLHADAVAIGEATAICDDPGLRVRDRSGRDPFRAVFAPRLELSPGLGLFRDNQDARTILVTRDDQPVESRATFEGLCRVIAVPPDGDELDLEAALRALASAGLLDILLESGGRLGAALWRKNLLRKLLVMVSPLLSGLAFDRPPAPALAGLGPRPLRLDSIEKLGPDVALAYEVV
jgi:diaminohydroxyphosphoribosylaminopyrimidine deaminase/5-amino-6-(5-phosphoribosylamino)uracil reductase